MAEAKQTKKQQQKGNQKKPISRPSLSQTVTLNTPCAQRVYNRVYSEVSRNLYSLGVITHVLAEDDATAEELNNIVKERFDALKEKADDEIKRLETVRDDAGVSALPSYTDPEVVEHDVTTPMTFHFIRLLQNLDKIVILLDSLWLTEEIDVKQKLRSEYMWQKRVLKFSNQLRELNNRARKAAKSGDDSAKASNDQPQAEEPAKAEAEAKKAEAEPEKVAAVG